jgi:hypothetical protein
MDIKPLDDAYSLYIRYRDVEDNGYGNCCTCGKLVMVKGGQCGHFMSRKHMATRFDEQNTALQCVSCNIFNQGRQLEFSKFIDKKYGPGTADRILARSRGTRKFEQFEIDALTKHYKAEAERLKKEKGL